MLSNTDTSFVACFVQIAKLRLFTQLFEDELRDEFVFDATTQAFWHDCLPLLRIAAGPLALQVKNLRVEPVGAVRPKYATYLSYFHREWKAAYALIGDGGQANGTVAKEKDTYVDRLFGALAHLVDARYGLLVWMESFAKHHGVPSGADAAECTDCADPNAEATLNRHWQDAESDLEAFFGDTDEAYFRLNLIGRKVFLTALAFAVVAPLRFEVDVRSQALRQLGNAIDLAQSDWQRGRLQHKVALLEQLTPRQFHLRSLSPSCPSSSREA